MAIGSDWTFLGEEHSDESFQSDVFLVTDTDNRVWRIASDAYQCIGTLDWYNVCTTCCFDPISAFQERSAIPRHAWIFPESYLVEGAKQYKASLADREWQEELYRKNNKAGCFCSAQGVVLCDC
eukprot:TRINITY_DN66657_c6_g2_i1.p1 TRINITY_DN66657_c6_g2~~TRINITY_DN66657_c6_g2_i1.p1  ORF type:complete len:124 (+),score=2.56 TRINITY_DN66657_c6_g2_i1:155-526(+)